MIVIVRNAPPDLQATEIAEAIEERTGYEVAEVIVTNQAGDMQDQWWQGKG